LANKERRVATPEGAQFFGLPVGAIITKDVEDSKVTAAAKLGIKPPSGALTGGTKATSTQGAEKPLTAKKPALEGPLKFSVGKAKYGAPAGSKLIGSKGFASKLTYVLTQKGKVHAFNPEGEVPVDSSLGQVLAVRFSGDLSNDDKFEELVRRQGQLAQHVGALGRHRPSGQERPSALQEEPRRNVAARRSRHRGR
jgi:hypothetical protein